MSLALVESLLDNMRVVLKRRGADGILGIARNFKICDTSGSGQLDEDELAKCFRLCKLSLSQDEFAALFAFFDRGGNGLVSFDEFVKTIRGKMNKPRRNLVVKVFHAIDNAGDGSGKLTAEDIAPLYNVQEDPDVKDGSKTPEQVLGNMLQAFEGPCGDGQVTLDEWINYYENISAGIDDDDLFGTMVASTWSSLKAKDANGEEVQAVQYVSESDMNVLENILIKNIYAKATGPNVERTLKASFKQFDMDGSGEVSMKEFTKAMERFGLSVQQPNARGKGGIPLQVLRGLFDRYNKDLSESLSYQEFSDGLFKKEEPGDDENEGPINEQGGQNPWLPTLANRPSMDPHYNRPQSAHRVRSIANPAKNRFTLD